MSMHQQQKEEPWGNRDSLNVLLTYLNAHATACTVFLRHSFGTEALGWPGLFALLLILAVAGFKRSQGMQVYLVLWLAALACQRLYTFWLVRRGVVWHSQYQGWPWLGALFTGGNGKAAVFIIEPFLCFCTGG